MAKRGFTLSGVGIFITYLICMWMLGMVRDTQKMQRQLQSDMEQLKTAIVCKRAIVIDGGISEQEADNILSNLLEMCDQPLKK